jgi:hypothetical protein
MNNDWKRIVTRDIGKYRPESKTELRFLQMRIVEDVTDHKAYKNVTAEEIHAEIERVLNGKTT